MAYDYYASLTFPASAKHITEVAAWLDENPHVQEQEDEGLCTVSTTTASFGSIGLTSILDEHHVPYDHVHRDDIEVETWTVVVRFKHGKKVAYEVWPEDTEKEKLAKRLLKVLKAGLAKRAITICERASAPQFEILEKLAKDWTAQAPTKSPVAPAKQRTLHAR